MKTITILLLVLCNACNAQPIISMGAGYSNEGRPLVNLSLGVKVNKSNLYYNQAVHLSPKSNKISLLGLRYGFDLGTFQPVIGLDYHLHHNDLKYENNPLKLAYGLTKYFKPVVINFSVSGGIVYGYIGLYVLMD